MKSKSKTYILKKGEMVLPASICELFKAPSLIGGWAVQIIRKDGSVFLCANEFGNFTPIWSLRNRHRAVAHKKKLLTYGFKAKVVLVEFSEPKVIPTGNINGKGLS